MTKSIDSEVLGALHELGKNKEGILTQIIVNKNLISGTVDLMQKGYAEKERINMNVANYKLTEKGIELYDKIINYVSKEF